MNVIMCFLSPHQKTIFFHCMIFWIWLTASVGSAFSEPVWLLQMNLYQAIKGCLPQRTRTSVCENKRDFVGDWPFFFSTFFSGGLSGLRLGFSGLDLRERELSDLCAFIFNHVNLMRFTYCSLWFPLMHSPCPGLLLWPLGFLLL